MSNDGRARVRGFGAEEGARRELDVGVAIARPELHCPAGLLRDPLPQVLVGDEKDGAVGGDLIDNF